MQQWITVELIKEKVRVNTFFACLRFKTMLHARSDRQDHKKVNFLCKQPYRLIAGAF